jgi:hypothetical protein
VLSVLSWPWFVGTSYIDQGSTSSASFSLSKIRSSSLVQNCCWYAVSARIVPFTAVARREKRKTNTCCIPKKYVLLPSSSSHFAWYCLCFFHVLCQSFQALPQQRRHLALRVRVWRLNALCPNIKFCVRVNIFLEALSICGFMSFLFLF